MGSALRWALGAAVVAVGLAVWWRLEDPFVSYWPSPREREKARALIALHDYYETQAWR